jgi:hypothetical protein
MPPAPPAHLVRARDAHAQPPLPQEKPRNPLGNPDLHGFLITGAHQPPNRWRHYARTTTRPLSRDPRSGCHAFPRRPRRPFARQRHRWVGMPHVPKRQTTPTRAIAIKNAKRTRPYTPPSVSSVSSVAAPSPEFAQPRATGRNKTPHFPPPAQNEPTSATSCDTSLASSRLLPKAARTRHNLPKPSTPNTPAQNEPTSPLLRALRALRGSSFPSSPIIP